MATELMLTFSSSTIPSVTLVPLDTAETSGRFRVWLYLEDRNVLLWDRKAENGFPELKILVRELCDCVSTFVLRDVELTNFYPTETAVAGRGRFRTRPWSLGRSGKVNTIDYAHSSKM